jgi:hypothetical protein
MVTMFILILVGMICSRIGLVKESEEPVLSKLVVNLFNPMLLLSSVMSTGDRPEGKTLGMAALVAVATYLAFILISRATARFFSDDADERKMYQMMFNYGNVGFIGIPLVKAVYGSGPLIYVAVYVILFNILIYTYGVFTLEEGRERKKFEWADLKNVVNMGTIASVLALLIFFLEIPVPSFLNATATYLGNCVTPIALMIIGFYLSRASFSEVFFSKRIHVFSFVKLLVLPAIAVFLLKQLNLPDTVMGVSVLMISMPVGNMSVSLANQYGVKSDVCSQAIIVTTLFSVLTIPLVVSLI